MKVDLFSIGRFTVHTYGVMIAIGVILCVLMGYYRAKRYEMKAESVLDIDGLVAKALEGETWVRVKP